MRRGLAYGPSLGSLGHLLHVLDAVLTLELVLVAEGHWLGALLQHWLFVFAILVRLLQPLVRLLFLQLSNFVFVQFAHLLFSVFAQVGTNQTVVVFLAFVVNLKFLFNDFFFVQGLVEVLLR